MKKCNNCGELIGDNVDRCFNCGYDVKADREKALQEEKRKQEEIQLEKERIASIYGIYEYKTVNIMDDKSGASQMMKINNILNLYGSQGWRLHSIYTNEIGKTSHPSSLGLATTNATIDETIIIFERALQVGANSI